MTFLTRWLVALTRLGPSRHTPGEVIRRQRPIAADRKIRRFYDDKAMRSERDYDTKEAANG